jgi:hypothetical protein
MHVRDVCYNECRMFVHCWYTCDLPQTFTRYAQTGLTNFRIKYPTDYANISLIVLCRTDGLTLQSQRHTGIAVLSGT